MRITEYLEKDWNYRVTVKEADLVDEVKVIRNYERRIKDWNYRTIAKFSKSYDNDKDCNDKMKSKGLDLQLNNIKIWINVS